MNVQNMRIKILRNDAYLSESQRGFSLTEIAIVIGVIGILLGAVWMAAREVYETRRVNKAHQDIIFIVEKMRTLYSSGTIFDANDLTDAAIQANVFPPDMLNAAGRPTNPWGGLSGPGGDGIRIGSMVGWGGAAVPPTPNCPLARNILEVVVWGLTREQCTRLLSKFIGQDSPASCLYSDGSGSFLNPATTTLAQIATCNNNVVIHFRK